MNEKANVLKENCFVWFSDLENSKMKSLNIKEMVEENGRE
ncbi:MAG: hypothetical protein PWR30_309 [Candidatus Woesearchaeota archaeon]|nr:hypothetical protein [Candidatus Woesearchaeota archaeon]